MIINQIILPYIYNYARLKKDEQKVKNDTDANPPGGMVNMLERAYFKKESNIHNTGFPFSPITHLFPLAGQSGSRGVSSMINFEIKIWNNSKLHQSIQSCMSVLNWSRKKGKMQKSETDADPPWGDGERA